jgi:hypothetical protein
LGPSEEPVSFVPTDEPSSFVMSQQPESSVDHAEAERSVAAGEPGLVGQEDVEPTPSSRVDGEEIATSHNDKVELPNAEKSDATIVSSVENPSPARDVTTDFHDGNQLPESRESDHPKPELALPAQLNPIQPSPVQSPLTASPIAPRTVLISVQLLIDSDTPFLRVLDQALRPPAQTAETPPARVEDPSPLVISGDVASETPGDESERTRFMTEPELVQGDDSNPDERGSIPPHIENAEIQEYEYEYEEEEEEEEEEEIADAVPVETPQEEESLASTEEDEENYESELPPAPTSVSESDSEAHVLPDVITSVLKEEKAPALPRLELPVPFSEISLIDGSPPDSGHKAGIVRPVLKSKPSLPKHPVSFVDSRETVPRLPRDAKGLVQQRSVVRNWFLSAPSAEGEEEVPSTKHGDRDAIASAQLTDLEDNVPSLAFSSLLEMAHLNTVLKRSVRTEPPAKPRPASAPKTIAQPKMVQVRFFS